MISSILGMAIAALVGAYGGRLHLRATALKALDQSVHVPAGTLETKVNAAVDALEQLAVQKASAAASVVLQGK